MQKYGNISLQPKNDLDDLHAKFGHTNYDKDLVLTYTEPTAQDVWELAMENNKYSVEDRIYYANKYDVIIANFVKEYSKRHVYTNDVRELVLYVHALVNYYIFKYKLKFNAARPFQLANKYNIPLYPVDLTTTGTPSYPSGHAGVYYAFYIIFNILDPHPNYEIIKDNGWDSRVISGVHFDQDNEAAKKIVDELFKHDNVLKEFIANNYKHYN